MAARAAFFGDVGGLQQLLLSTPLFVRKDLYLWILAKSWLPPDRKELAYWCSSRDATCLTALLVCSSIHFKAVLWICIHTSTNKCSLKTVGALQQCLVFLSLKSAPQSNHTAVEKEVLCQSYSYFFIECITAPKRWGETTSTDSYIWLS